MDVILRGVVSRSSIRSSRLLPVRGLALGGLAAAEIASAGLAVAQTSAHAGPMTCGDEECTIAIDFLTVPTVTFHVLYVFFVISLERRRVLHVNVTARPYGAWSAQQIVE